MDHRNITLNGVDVSYAYDSQVVVGVALDRTGSMQGLTPDPLTGMPPNISKLDAAKQGVAAFLQDAEAAYQAGEAYVVAGVEVFRNNAGANEVVPVSPATPPYGLVKSGSPYGRAQFQLDVAAVTASGGTPLAAALTETEDEMVRLPFANRPPNEQRYLCILTDGKETSPPLLSTLGTPEFPDTMIFALGFGIGSGWDGVDYATIDSLKSKGKLAPVGVEQAFHGENAGIIDKFYTNSIAHTLGFAAIVDPMFELFPGEEVMVPFVATDTDQAFMITAQGFDYQDRNWSFHLMGPDGVMYHDHGAPMTDPLIITTVRNQARLTLFLNRGTATPAQWVGTWNVMAVYMPKAKDRQMMMPSDWELLVPIGAPPLRGPLYTRFDQPISKRRAVRQQRPIKGAPLLQASGVNTTEPGNPCTVGINIYGRGVTTARVEIRTRERFAGNSIDVIVRLEDLAGGRLARANVVGRLVAPAFSLGNLFADLKTIKRSARRKYLLKRDGREVFDELQFLADYENAKPGALALRDEPLRFERRDDDSFVARIGATRHPGVYRVAVRVEGAVARAKCNDPVFRIVNAAVALGVKPDPGHSKPTLHWLAPDRFVVTFTPTDALGNKAWLSNAAPPVLLFRRQPLVAEFRDLYDGNYQLEVTLGGKPLVTADGCHCRGARFTVTNGADITMQAGQLLRLTLRIGQSVIPVLLPTALAGPKGKPIPAGSPAAMKIPVDRRVVLSYREPPAGIGGSGAPGDAPSEHDAGNDHHH
jgi:hypothetical protein